MNTRRALFCLFALCGAALLLPQIAHAAEPEGMLDTVLDLYRTLGHEWLGRLLPTVASFYAKAAALQFILMLLGLALVHRHGERAHLQYLLSRVVWIIIMTSVGGAMVLYSGEWVHGIFMSMVRLGEHVTGAYDVSPSTLSTQGLIVTNQMYDAASDAGLMGWRQSFTSFTPLLVTIAGLVTNLAFIGIAVQFMLTEMAFYITLGVAPFFVAFLGFFPLAGLAEGFFRFLLALAVKIFLLILLSHVASDVPALATHLFPEGPSDVEYYHDLAEAQEAGGWTWDKIDLTMPAEEVQKAAVVLIIASISTLLLITGITYGFVRAVTSSVNLNIASWWA